MFLNVKVHGNLSKNNQPDFNLAKKTVRREIGVY